MADDKIGHHRGRRLGDRTPQRLVRHVSHCVPVQAYPQPHFVATGGIDVVDFGVVRLSKSTVMLAAVVIKNDLLVEVLDFHRSPPKKPMVYSRPSINASISACVVYR